MPRLTDHGAPSAAARATASTTSARRGSPLARRAICPPGPSTNTVGVRRTSNCRARSVRAATSISTCTMPSPRPARSASSCLVARHGVQKAEENCSKVARVPSGWPRSASVSRRTGDSRIRPSRRRQANPATVPRTRTVPSTTTPAATTPTARPGPAAFPGATPSQARPSSSAPSRAPACCATALGPHLTPPMPGVYAADTVASTSPPAVTSKLRRLASASDVEAGYQTGQPG
jgi:hypothetical protein